MYQSHRAADPPGEPTEPKMTRITYTTDGDNEIEMVVDYRASERQAWREAVKANGGGDCVVLFHEWLDEDGEVA